ncbi:MAG: ATP-grasp domain-containing protein [Roseibium sp.]|uniref:ATP-grasp domain-containing protein n=1 Tax=Roseibium sp. TaxID=1936156 RepID=UPI00260F285F|nr:ATP-grasp domain-containing protein [Roseibium sp.]MCV0426773.1 ATP-grasp domain-containing protein [Roseibium sp.]
MSDRKRVLVTAGRFMPATGVVHALHKAGATVEVADSFDVAPALHSRFIDKAHIVPAASQDPIGYTREIARISDERSIDLILPTFEDSIYLARYADYLPVPRFAAEFDVLAELHDKAAFVAVCERLGLKTPATEIVSSHDEMVEAISRFDDFFARPAFSRAGIGHLTNHGEALDSKKIEQCSPTPSNPWLVQDYVEGKDTCVMCIAHEGRPVVVAVYEPAIAAGGGYSVRFTSIEDPAAVAIVTAVCSAYKYTGFIGFDYRRTDNGPVLMECNPRVTAGVFLTDERILGEAILNSDEELFHAPAGMSRQYDSYLVYGRATTQSTPEVIKSLLSGRDALVSQRDYLPFLYSFLARSQYKHQAYEEHKSFSDIFLNDIVWDGTPLPDAG